MIDNFKSRPKPRQSQQVDGILHLAPNRSQFDGRQTGRRPFAGNDQMRTSTRTIGDFKRADGYHAVNTAIGSPSTPSKEIPKRSEGPSLHATLPGGKLHKDKRKFTWRAVRKWSLRGGLGLLVVIVLLGGFLFTKGIFKANKIFKGGGSAVGLNDNVSPSLLKGEGDGRINFLLLGRGGDGHAGADLTDTILVASIDPVNNRAALLSIPRDLWVAGPRGGSMKINAVFATAKNSALNSNPKDKAKAEAAGVTALDETVSEVLGITIHYYAMVDFTAFKQAVDTVGGVDINVPEELAVTEKLWDPTTRKNYLLDVDAGQQHFDGQRALFFTRTRHTSTRGDFDRAERQRLFIAALSSKVLSAGTYTNPVKISQLMDAFGDHIATDLSLNDAVRLASIGKKVGNKIDSIGLADPPHSFLRTGMIGNQSVVLPVAGVGNYDDIQMFVRSQLKDGYILKENATITVLNGTSTPGLAAKKAEELRTYGYNVVTVGDAPTHAYTKTVVVDLTKGKKPYTKNYLEKRFDVKTTTKLPDTTIQAGTASFVIILGEE
jgi:LCP family protein required for cell wall assembly